MINSYRYFVVANFFIAVVGTVGDARVAYKSIENTGQSII